MRRIEFKKPERTKEILRKEIRRSDEARYDHRLHAVLLAVDGRSPYDIAELLGDAPRSVYNWIKLFREDGLQGLREEMRSGRPMRLDGNANPILGQGHGEVPRGIRLRPSDLGWCFVGPSSREDLRRYAGREAMPAHISSSRHAPVTASHLTKRSRCGCPGGL